MKPILLTLFVVLSSFVYGQVSNDFTRIVCAGEMPEDFKTAFSDKYKSDLAHNDVESNLSRRDAVEFAVLTNYTNHRLLTGGTVMYGDHLSTYANDILSKLLVNNPDLRQELRVYTIKSNQVNAYSTNQGIIYVTLGLFGKVENEAQLAYVLAHEISHYNKRHVLQSFENHKEIWAKGGSYRNLNKEERSLTAFKYSREAEFEADKEGLTYYKDAGYEIGEIYKGFDGLLHGYLPIKQQPYSWGKLENDSFKISDHYLIDSCAAIKEVEDVDDESLTHPNVQRRKRAIKKIIAKDSMSINGVVFQIISQKEFVAIQDLARFEMVNTFLRQGKYAGGLYHIQMMLDDYPDHPFLKRAELMCWYGMQKMAANQQKSVYSTGYRKVEGQEQAVYYFAAKMPRRGINVLATKFIWEQTDGMVMDSFVTIIRRQSLEHLAQSVDSDFLLTSYDKPKVKSSKRKRKPKKISFVKIAFVELFKNESFKAQYDEAFANNTKKEEEEDLEYEDDKSERLSDSYVQGVSSYYGLSSVNKLLYISPKFYRIDLRKDLDQRLVSSENEQTDLQERSEKLSKMAGIDLVTLNGPNPVEKNTEAFNDYVTIQDWLREESLYEGTGFFSHASLALPQIREKYGTDYLGVNYVSHFTERNQFNGTYLFLSIITFYPLPLYLYWQLRPLHNLEYNFIVFDLKAGDIGFFDIKSFSAKYKRGIINAHLYNSFNQLNRLR
ncbi:MAG: hypothetical protein ACI9JN_001835 [Bacteroidia bacterium]|jgi:hypothetical protein